MLHNLSYYANVFNPLYIRKDEIKILLTDIVIISHGYNSYINISFSYKLTHKYSKLNLFQTHVLNAIERIVATIIVGQSYVKIFPKSQDNGLYGTIESPHELYQLKLIEKSVSIYDNQTMAQSTNGNTFQ